VSTSSPFDTKDYWEKRFASSTDLSTVGYAGLGKPFNQWMYRLRRRVFLRTVTPLAADVDLNTVLDVGSGSGFYIDRWHELRAGDIRACDITDVAVHRLRSKYPQHEVTVLDVSSESDDLPAWQVDAISAFDITFHIVSDTRLRQAFVNMFSLLRPGGLLIFTDNFVQSTATHASHHVSRTKTTLEGAVHAAGFEIVSRKPAFFFMNQPVDTDSALHRRSWEIMTSTLRRWPTTGYLFGPLLFPIDLTLVKLLSEGPSTEIMVCRKPADKRAKI
jgi:SAM-dependent methyltransferase